MTVLFIAPTNIQELLTSPRRELLFCPQPVLVHGLVTDTEGRDSEPANKRLKLVARWF